MKRIGLLPPTIANTQNLKRDFLFFDQFSTEFSLLQHDFELWISLLEKIKHPRTGEVVNQLEKRRKDIEGLFNQGVIIDENFETSIGKYGLPKRDVKENEMLILKQLFDDFQDYASTSRPEKITSEEEALNFVQYHQKRYQIIENLTRTSSFFLNKVSIDNDFLPILSQNIEAGNILTERSDVMELILKNLPFPDEGVEWKQLLDFKSDPDSQVKLMNILRWINKVARSEFSAKELVEEITYLCTQYESHMDYHKIKYRHDKVEILIVSTLEFIENVAKLNWSKAAKMLFELNKQDFQLYEAERKAPGREVAYISKIKKEF